MPSRDSVPRRVCLYILCIILLNEVWFSWTETMQKIQVGNKAVIWSTILAQFNCRQDLTRIGKYLHAFMEKKSASYTEKTHWQAQCQNYNNLIPN